MTELISRQAVEDLIMETDPFWCEGMTRAIFEGIKRLPTIEPKRGKWESNEYLYTTRQTRCSECKTEFYVDDLLNVGEGAQEYLPNYCPHCGARMYEVSDE